MANARMLTLLTNLAEARRLPYIPPNGKVMETGETVIIPGALETEIYLGMLKTANDEYVHDLLYDRISISTEGFGGSGAQTYFKTLIGDNVSTIFVLEVGFATANARLFLFDELGGGPIYFYEAGLATPGPTQVTLTLIPAPAVNQVCVFIFPALS